MKDVGRVGGYFNVQHLHSLGLQVQLEEIGFSGCYTLRGARTYVVVQLQASEPQVALTGTEVIWERKKVSETRQDSVEDGTDSVHGGFEEVVQWEFSCSSWLG